MITTSIGKIFLKAYNEKYGTSLSAEKFFNDIFYPLVFDRNKYLMTAGNSPLENNPKIEGWGQMIIGKKDFESKQEREIRYQKFKEKINKGIPDAEIAVGYPTTNITRPTTSQVSNIDIRISVDDLYVSWIGAALSCGISGGQNIAFFNEALLLDIFKGWEVYSTILENNKLLKGNQINAWNSFWLTYIYARDYNSDQKIPPLQDILKSARSKKYIGCLELSQISWTKLLISICQHFDAPKIMGYVFSVGNTNDTIGFLPFVLDQIRRPIQLYKRLFGMDNKDNKAEDLWGTEMGFQIACQHGAIGFTAMKPKGLHKYAMGEKIPKHKNNEQTIILYHTYITWIIAMLNKEELWDKAQEFANVLQKYAEINNRGKTENTQRVKNVLESKSQFSFLNAIEPIAKDIKEKDKIEEMAKLVHNMPADNVPYFLTLIRLHHALINKTYNE